MAEATAREIGVVSLVEAHAAGESPSLIAHVSGYTVQCVHQIVAAKKKS